MSDFPRCDYCGCPWHGLPCRRHVIPTGEPCECPGSFKENDDR